jgi:hypothetical protein
MLTKETSLELVPENRSVQWKVPILPIFLSIGGLKSAEPLPGGAEMQCTIFRIFKGMGTQEGIQGR